jgi:hypothetical protein
LVKPPRSFLGGRVLSTLAALAAVPQFAEGWLAEAEEAWSCWGSAIEFTHTIRPCREGEIMLRWEDSEGFVLRSSGGEGVRLCSSIPSAWLLLLLRLLAVEEEAWSCWGSAIEFTHTIQPSREGEKTVRWEKGEGVMLCSSIHVSAWLPLLLLRLLAAARSFFFSRRENTTLRTAMVMKMKSTRAAATNTAVQLSLGDGRVPGGGLVARASAGAVATASMRLVALVSVASSIKAAMSGAGEGGWGEWEKIEEGGRWYCFLWV